MSHLCVSIPSLNTNPLTIACMTLAHSSQLDWLLVVTSPQRRCYVLLCVVLISAVGLHLAILEDWTRPIKTLHRSVMKAGWPFACDAAPASLSKQRKTPRYAYVQYATDLDYLCNAVGPKVEK